MKTREELLQEIKKAYSHYCSLVDEYNKYYLQPTSYCDETLISAGEFLDSFYI